MIISEAYVINLEHRKDRLLHITGECEKHDLKMHVIPAVDGHSKYHNIEKRKRGFFGCYDSHLTLLKMLQDTRGDYFLIVEDDCVFADDFRIKLLEYYKQLPPTWEMLYLGGSAIVDGATEAFSYNLHKANY